jgi:hypothetical protein
MGYSLSVSAGELPSGLDEPEADAGSDDWGDRRDRAVFFWAVFRVVFVAGFSSVQPCERKIASWSSF